MFDAVPLRILLVTLAGWVNRHQLEVIEYLREENRVLKEHLGGRRLPRVGACKATAGRFNALANAGISGRCET